MIATTVGLGPFKPAISFNGRTWVCGKEFFDEDEAVKEAQRTVEKILARATEVLTRHAYQPEESHR